MILAALLAALTMSGAPATTPVSCSPVLFAGGEAGLAYPARVIPGGPPQPLTNISLYGPLGCAATLYGSETPLQRKLTARLNRGVNFPRVVGQGFLLVLHEGSHVGLNSRDECVVERQAWALYPALVSRFFGRPFAQLALPYAAAYNAQILAFYHCP